jgi:hypothetical protein
LDVSNQNRSSSSPRREMKGSTVTSSPVLFLFLSHAHGPQLQLDFAAPAGLQTILC